MLTRLLLAGLVCTLGGCWGCDGMSGDRLMGFRQPHTELRIDPNTGAMVYSSERDTELSASQIDFGAFRAKNLRVVGNATNPTRANAALVDAALPLLIAERQRIAQRDAIVGEKVSELFDLIRDLAPYLKQAQPSGSQPSGPGTTATASERIGAVLRDIRDVIGPRYETERVP